MNLPRLNAWMNSGAKLMVNAIIVVALSTGVLACPVWMTSTVQAEVPCSDCDHTKESCPPSVCQISSPYLASLATPDVHPPAELPAESLDSDFAGLVSAGADDFSLFEGPPPGLRIPLYLRTHSLLV
jgi:hypothetical protein